jgi:hypothetical protein
LLTALSVTFCALSGCMPGETLDRQSISGSVALNGQPLDSGAILFEPISEQTGTAVGATIQDGRYVISRKDGPAPGKYKVRIYASSREQAPARPGASEKKPRPMVELIPEKYNSQTILKAEVFSDKRNSLTYDLVP